MTLQRKLALFLLVASLAPVAGVGFPILGVGAARARPPVVRRAPRARPLRRGERRGGPRAD